LNILLLITQMEAAGAQKAVLILARGLQQRGHIVTVVTMYDKRDYVPLFRQKYGVEIIDLEMKAPSHASLLQKPIYVLRGLARLWGLMRKRQFDVVQTFSHYSNIIGPMIACLAGVRTRVSSQRMSLKERPTWLLWLDRWIANSFLVDKMVSVSEGTRRFCIEVQRISPEKLITIRNSIDLDRFSPTAIDKTSVQHLRSGLGLSVHSHVVITVARLHPQKGHRFLIEAIPAIIEKFPDTQFLFGGEGELQESLHNYVKRLGIESHVHFLGMRQDIPELLALSDLFVLPSLWEGLPNAVLEAMAMGTPVVATAVDGCPEVIHDGQTGLLVPPGNSEALSQAICCLLGNPKLRLQLAHAAQSLVIENYSEEKNISAFEQLYTQLVLGKA